MKLLNSLLTEVRCLTNLYANLTRFTLKQIRAPLFVSANLAISILPYRSLSAQSSHSGRQERWGGGRGKRNRHRVESEDDPQTASWAGGGIPALTHLKDEGDETGDLRDDANGVETEAATEREKRRWGGKVTQRLFKLRGAKKGAEDEKISHLVTIINKIITIKPPLAGKKHNEGAIMRCGSRMTICLVTLQNLRLHTDERRMTAKTFMWSKQIFESRSRDVGSLFQHNGLLVTHSVPSFGPDRNICQLSDRLSLKSSTGIHRPRMMQPTDFGESLFFHSGATLAPEWKRFKFVVLSEKSC